MLSSLATHKNCLIIIAVLVVMLGFLIQQPVQVSEVVKHTTDTLVVVKRDTVTTTKIVEVVKDRVVVDTAYISVNDTVFVPVPISSYHFRENNQYDITARGYNVSLESVTVFPKTVYKTTTSTTETIKTVEAFALYAGAGLWYYNNAMIPHASIAAKIPKNWIISADLGYYNSNVIFGGTALYKFTQK